MGKISGYGNDSTPNLSDKLIGTDVNDLNATKNFTIGQILSLGTSSGLFVPYTGATGAVNLGAYGITANSFVKAGGTSSQFLKADGSVDSTTYATAASVTALTPYYGSFFDSTTQTALVANTAYAVKLNSTDLTATSGFSILTDGFGDKTIIKAANAGVYNIAFSAQLRRGSGGSSESINFWLRKNGTNVPSTNTAVSVQANAGLLVAAWNFFIQMDAGAEAQLMWSTSSIAIDMPYAAASGVHPATPSVILTVNKVG
jgi:hypothetical protein